MTNIGHSYLETTFSAIKVLMDSKTRFKLILFQMNLNLCTMLLNIAKPFKVKSM